ncbi:MAG: YabP/YqfC family sporulation protein [Clostridia bacterium]
MEENLHNLILEGREKLTVSGVKNVVSFNDGEVVLTIADATIYVKGNGLKVENVSKEKGEVNIKGDIVTSINYSKSVKKSEGILGRMFK